MDEQCQFSPLVPSIRDDPFINTPSPQVFCQSPNFRTNLVHMPTAKEWQRIAAGMHPKEECVVHPKDRISYKGKKYQIGRLFYEWFVEPLDDDVEIRKSCGTLGCVYPTHLSTKKRISHADGVFQMWKNRHRDVNLTQLQRSQKYKIPQHVVKRKDQNRTYKYLPFLSSEAASKSQFNFLEPPTELVVFLPLPEK